MKLKKQSSSKEKKRYLHFKVISDSEKPLPYFELKNAVWNAVLNWFGEKGAGESGFRVIKNLYSEKKKEGVLQCSPKHVDDVKTALATIRFIGDAEMIFTIDIVSGTIKSIREKKTISS